jgi:hypothetical protein
MVRLPLLLSLACTTLIATNSVASPSFRLQDGVHPVVVGVDKSILFPGENVTVTVSLSGPADGTEELDVSVVQGSFLSVPSVIYPVAGQTSVSFSAVVGNNLGSDSLMVSDDGVAIVETVQVLNLSQLLHLLGLG